MHTADRRRSAIRKSSTLAGLGTPEHPHPLQTAYVEEQVPQCAYCINGWIMTAAAFLRDNKKPTDEEIRTALRTRQMPLRDPHGHPPRRQARRSDDGLREDTMTRMEKSAHFSRRTLLKAGGALVVSIGAPIAFEPANAAGDATAAAIKPPLTPDQLVVLHRRQR